MRIDSAIIKHYLKNVLFINGTAYAGKSTMVRLLAETYGLLACGENYDCVPEGVATPEAYPNLCYFDTMKDWQAFVGRTPRQYDDWIQGCSRELVGFEIAYLMRASATQRVIVDTNIPADVLHEIADYNQVAIMLCPQAMSVDHFFNRGDPEKAFIKEQIMKAADPQKTMDNYLAGIAEINSQAKYDAWAASGFYTVVRDDAQKDTRQETMALLASHFGLTK